MTVFIGLSAPEFTSPTLMPDASIDYNFALTAYRAQQKCVLFFYAMNFAQVDPTELIALSQAYQEFIPGFAMWSFVGHRPNHHGAAVFIAIHHIPELIGGILVGIRVVPSYGPINRDFRPYHQTHFFGSSHHMFVVRIMGQTYKITAHFFGPRQEQNQIGRAHV